MSAMDEHQVIEDPEGGHNANEVLLDEVVLSLFNVIGHLFLCQDELDPLKLSEMDMNHREEVLQNKAPLSPLMEFHFQSSDRTLEQIVVQGQEQFSLSGYHQSCLL